MILNTFPGPDVIAHIRNLSTGEAEALESESQPGLDSKFQARLHSETLSKSERERETCLFDRFSSLPTFSL